MGSNYNNTIGIRPVASSLTSFLVKSGFVRISSPLPPTSDIQYKKRGVAGEAGEAGALSNLSKVGALAPLPHVLNTLLWTCGLRMHGLYHNSGGAEPPPSKKD